jgi:hypothetical protein
LFVLRLAQIDALPLAFTLLALCLPLRGLTMPFSLRSVLSALAVLAGLPSLCSVCFASGLAVGETLGETLGGERAVWHVLELSFQHDQVLSEGGTPNPFFDFRLDVVFDHPASGVSYSVPGFYDADGDAANTSEVNGDMFRVRFTPDRPGTWNWSTSFRAGAGVAVSTIATAGSPASFDGASGSFLVHPANPSLPGLRGRGRLSYTGERLLRFEGNAEPFLKSGVDSPENLLGYWEFDGTVDTGGKPNALDSVDGLHHFGAHLDDYTNLGGGPTWKGGKGKGLVGGLNYLASVGVNSVYFLTYNIDGGDGGEVHPWASAGSKLRYDVSKLSQWELVFDHMSDLGLVMHLVLQEEENDNILDGGGFGDQRMLYHREMVARFGCSLGLVWNIGEETSLSDSLRMTTATHLRSLDPYNHPIAVHTSPSQLDAVYGALLGFPDMELCSMQILPEETHSRTLEWGSSSAAAGRAWVVSCDEQNPADKGAVPDTVDPNHSELRREVLWGNLLAGGGGPEYYFGYAWPNNDLDCEDWRSRANLWRQTDLGLAFLRSEVDHLKMSPSDELTQRPAHICMSEAGEVYLIYTPDDNPPRLDLEGNAGTYTVSWFDAQSGGDLQLGQITSVTGPGQVSLGPPPAGGRDWVALVRLVSPRPPSIDSHSAVATAEGGLTTVLVELHGEDPNGPSDLLAAGMFLRDPSGADQGYFPLDFAGGDLFAAYVPGLANFMPGTWTYTLALVDSSLRYDLVSGVLLAP